MKQSTLFSASDKSLFDALNQRNVTNSDLRSLFLTRGVLVSSESSRKQLAGHFARLFHDYHDYQKLASLFGSAASREKFSAVRVTGDVTIDAFYTAGQELKNKLQEDGVIVHVYASSGNRLDIGLKYTKTHFNKSDFRQVVGKNAKISIIKEKDGFSIHHPYADELHEWINELVNIVKTNTEVELKFDEIRLPPTMSPKVKTTFLKSVIKHIQGFKVKDVTDVYVAKERVVRSDLDDDDDIGKTEIRIDKATLRGLGVLETPELKSLEETHGFYVSRIIWTAEQPGHTSDIYEFEAQFSRPDECADFTYLARGFYKYLEDGKYNTTRASLPTDEELKYGRLIEAAAREIFKSLMSQLP